jgi:hypothetical protein
MSFLSLVWNVVVDLWMIHVAVAPYCSSESYLLCEILIVWPKIINIEASAGRSVTEAVMQFQFQPPWGTEFFCSNVMFWVSCGGSALVWVMVMFPTDDCCGILGCNCINWMLVFAMQWDRGCCPWTLIFFINMAKTMLCVSCESWTCSILHC